MRRLLLKVHEWLADRTKYVQYPAPARYVPRTKPKSILTRLAYRWRYMNGAQRGWVYFVIFWGGVILLSIYGNLID